MGITQSIQSLAERILFIYFSLSQNPKKGKRQYLNNKALVPVFRIVLKEANYFSN